MLCKVDTLIDGTFKLKGVTIMVGILDVILASVGSCGDKNDIYFLVTVLVFFSLSFLHLLCTLLDVFKANFTSRGVEFLFHLTGGIMILVTSIVMLSGTDASSCHVMEKTAAATVGIFNALIYIYICWLILSLLRKKDKASGGALPLYIFCGISSVPVFTAEEFESPEVPRKVSNSSIPTRLAAVAQSRIVTQESIMVKGSELPVSVGN